MAERQTSMTPVREERGIGRTRPSAWSGGPFTMMQRFADEVDRMFEDFGMGRRDRGWPSSGGERLGAWAPDVEAFQKGDQFIIKADLPGLKKEDVHVDVTDDVVTIEGERKSEHEEQREGVYHSERSYGTFSRSIPLPAGAMIDQAKATFRDGVLEITMPSPPATTRGRRLEITEETGKAK